ncbi:uncharacterized protein LOC123327038 [Drosophila simulans]|uniref:uncharacterized protein LOC123327038 n=1 Tax=Drosophila simulans TaxID=7240 RepID=UPI001D10F094|nr:uncharacterized protein LOC123327038 [Drosophila simulans]
MYLCVCIDALTPNCNAIKSAIPAKDNHRSRNERENWHCLATRRQDVGLSTGTQHPELSAAATESDMPGGWGGIKLCETAFSLFASPNPAICTIRPTGGDGRAAAAPGSSWSSASSRVCVCVFITFVDYAYKNYTSPRSQRSGHQLQQRVGKLI